MMNNFKRGVFGAVSCAVLLAVFAVDVGAQELNKRKGPAPGDQATVNRVMSKSRVQSEGINNSDGELNRDCGDIDIGNIQSTGRGGRRTGNQTNITVVRGPVISACNR